MTVNNEQFYAASIPCSIANIIFLLMAGLFTIITPLKALSDPSCSDVKANLAVMSLHGFTHLLLVFYLAGFSFWTWSYRSHKELEYKSTNQYFPYYAGYLIHAIMCTVFGVMGMVWLVNGTIPHECLDGSKKWALFVVYILFCIGVIMVPLLALCLHQDDHDDECFGDCGSQCVFTCTVFPILQLISPAFIILWFFYGLAYLYEVITGKD